MREMRRNRRADQDALQLRQEGPVSHTDLQWPTGLADGLEVGVLYHRRLSLERHRPDEFAPARRLRRVGPPYRSDRSELGTPNYAGPGCESGSSGPGLYGLFTTFSDHWSTDAQTLFDMHTPGDAAIDSPKGARESPLHPKLDDPHRHGHEHDQRHRDSARRLREPGEGRANQQRRQCQRTEPHHQQPAKASDLIERQVIRKNASELALWYRGAWNRRDHLHGCTLPYPPCTVAAPTVRRA